MVNIATLIHAVNGWLGFEMELLSQTIDEKIPSVFVLHFETFKPSYISRRLPVKEDSCDEGLSKATRSLSRRFCLSFQFFGEYWITGEPAEPTSWCDSLGESIEANNTAFVIEP